MGNLGKIEKKSRQHTVYKDSNGKRVVGVTTVTGVMNKPALVKWANGLGLRGIDSTTYVDALAGVGTCAHLMVTDGLMDLSPDLGSFSRDQIDLAENCVVKWHYWKDSHDLKPIFVEKPLVSDKYGYGGTCDIYCELDGKKTLIDLKTSKGIYDEMFTQVTAYGVLLKENGYDVEQAMIVRIGRNDDEGTEPEVKSITRSDLHWKRFQTCLELYRLNNEIRKG